MLAANGLQLFTDELLKAAAVGFFSELGHHAAKVDRCRAQLELAHGFENLERVVYRQLDITINTVASITVSFEYLNNGTIDQATTIDRCDHVVIAIELADHRNHRFRKGFSIDPLTKTLVGLLIHRQYLPHM